MAKKTLTINDHKHTASILKCLHNAVMGMRNDICKRGGKVACFDICRALDDADQSLFIARDKLDLHLFRTLGRTVDPAELRGIYLGAMNQDDLRAMNNFIHDLFRKHL